jgi:hypothetical protein
MNMSLFPSGTLVAVPVQPREDSRESQLVHRVLSGGTELSGGWEARPGVEHTTTTIHLSTLAHSNILVCKWNEPDVHITGESVVVVIGDGVLF